MDILQWMKLDHESMLRSVEKLGHDDLASRGAGSSQAAIGNLVADLAVDLLAHLKAEEEFLVPEIADRFPGAEVYADLCAANHKVLKKQLKSLLSAAESGDAEAITGAVSGLKKAVEQHLDVQETQLMPRLRQHVPTAEREDLGLLIEDMMAEVRSEGLDIAAELKAPRDAGRAKTKGRARA
ncbi:MAG: Hemerythrin cation binding domain [Pseudomonadota bacterium]